MQILLQNTLCLQGRTVSYDTWKIAKETRLVGTRLGELRNLIEGSK